MNALQTLVEVLLISSVHRDIIQIGAIMAALFDDKPPVAGINEDWDEQTTGRQIMRPEWDFSPIRMKTMHPYLTYFRYTTPRKARLSSANTQ